MGFFNKLFQKSAPEKSISVETASGKKVKKVSFDEAESYIALVKDGQEDFIIFQAQDGFIQFYGIGNQFICEAWFNLNGNRAYAIINPDCTSTRRVNFETPYGQYTPRECDIIPLEQLKKAVQDFFLATSEKDFLSYIPHEKMVM